MLSKIILNPVRLTYDIRVYDNAEKSSISIQAKSLGLQYSSIILSGIFEIQVTGTTLSISKLIKHISDEYSKHEIISIMSPLASIGP